MTEVVQDPGRLLALLDASHVAIVATDTGRIVTEWAGAAEQIYGFTAEEMIGQPIDLVWPAARSDEDLRAFAKLVRGELVDLRSERVRKDGSTFVAELNARPVFDDDGAWAGTITISRDVTQSHEHSQAVDVLLAAGDLAVIAIDAERRITQWAGAAPAMYGWEAAEILGEDISVLWPRDDHARNTEAFSIVAEHGSKTVRTWRRRRDGSTFLAEMTITETDRLLGGGLVSVSRDITEKYELQKRAWAAEQRFAAAFNAAALPLVICELDGTVVESNEAYVLLAARVEPPATERFLDLIEPTSRPPVAAAMGTLATDSGRFEGIEVPIAGSDNHILNLSIAPVDDGPDGPPLALVQLIDVSDQLRIQTELAEIATLDPLTQVFNRSCFEPLLASMSAGQDVGLLFIDLDRFKAVNDDLGHAAGDIVLQTIAARLEAVVRESDYVIRFGGDEFVIVCPGLADPGGAERLGERLRASVAQPIDIDGEPALVSASIGVSLVQSGPDLDLEAAIGRADAAMYEAKAAGRNATVIAALA